MDCAVYYGITRAMEKAMVGVGWGAGNARGRLVGLDQEGLPEKVTLSKGLKEPQECAKAPGQQ